METELILNSDGSVYHLKLKPGELAKKIIFVGDPDRVEKVAKHFDRIEFKRQKREFVTITGYLKGERLSVISTGIGPDNIDIVWNEIDALFNIDFESRIPFANPESIKVLRLGTCGGMQEEIPVGSMVLSNYAIGGDSLMQYYDVDPMSVDLAQTLRIFQYRNELFYLPLYVASGDDELWEEVAKADPDILGGITFTAAGFYGPQGRSLGRIPVRIPELPDIISQFEYDNHQVLNMEMETAAILALGNALGHQAASLCVILANRITGDFHDDPFAAEAALIEKGLFLLRCW